MAPIPSIFVLPIEPNGSIICTQPTPKVYLLTFQLPPDNRLVPAFNTAFLLALNIIEHKLPKGVVVTTSGIAKFYSNGLNLDIAQSTPGFFHDSIYPLWSRLLSYPMPTVALINGHCFAGGMLTAMMHDYRIMNPHKGFLCMNELDFGVPLTPPMSSIFRQKLRADAYRTLVLEAKRFNALDALKDGLVDGLGGIEEALSFINESKLQTKAQSGVYGSLKEEMWKETLGYLNRGEAQEQADVRARSEVLEARSSLAVQAVEAWSNQHNGKAKL